MKAVIPAAGLGTRFLPMTKSIPKEMLPVLAKPAIQYVVEEAVASGCDDVLVVTGRSKRALEDHFDHAPELEAALAARGETDLLATVEAIAGIDLHFVRQKEPRGLGHAVRCAERHVGGATFAVLLGDDVYAADPPATRQLLDAHRRLGGSVVAVEEVPRERTALYGIVTPGEDAGGGAVRLRDIVEKPRPADAPSTLAASGRYVFTPGIFRAMQRVAPDARGEVQLTDCIRELAKDEPVHALRFRGTRYDIGNPLDWLRTNVDLALGSSELGPPLRAWLDERLRRP